ncbi:hypothetical protein STENM223S_07693 [Streptomyces tendae]
MRRNYRATLTAAAALTMAATAMGVQTASAAPAKETSPTVAASPCGWYTVLSRAYYNHCGTGNVVIFVDRLNIGGIRDYEQCVTPGDHYLGSWPDFQGAWYAGKTC